MTLADRCVANSVDWYAAVLGAHGIEGTVDRGVWATRSAVPPYYSNAVTVAPGPAGAQLAAIADLAAGIGRTFTVKDSYASLDLAPLGFDVLIAGEWIHLDPGAAPAGVAGDLAGFHPWTVETAGDLARWEAAWQEGGSPASTRVFPPGLLADPAVRFLAMEREGRIVAGCAANRSADVIGFSNFFVRDADAEMEAILARAVARTSSLAPGVPVVGWESGEALDRAVRLGFGRAGPLRVWIRRAPAPAAGA